VDLRCLVFVASQFSFDGHVRAFGEGAGEIGQFAEGPEKLAAIRKESRPPDEQQIFAAQRVWEIRVDSVLKLDRAAKTEADENQPEGPH